MARISALFFVLCSLSACTALSEPSPIQVAADLAAPTPAPAPAPVVAE